MIKLGQYPLINMKNIEQRAMHAGGIGNCLNRYVGKTTWAVLDAITRAIANPGTAQRVNDPDADTAYQRRNLQALVATTIFKLELQDMSVKGTRDGVEVISTFAQVVYPPAPPVRREGLPQ